MAAAFAALVWPQFTALPRYGAFTAELDRMSNNKSRPEPQMNTDEHR
jgi:hypothetical protein